MFENSIRCTHNGTGGTGTLTLAAVTGWPQPSKAYGTSGTLNVYYTITEYTDATLSVEKNFEAGQGSLVLSTGVLTRSVVQTTWDGTTFNSTTATALSFGNTAANVVITLGASRMNTMGALPIVVSSVPSGFAGVLGLQGFNTRCQWDSGTSGLALTAGTRMWVPIEFRGGLITNVAVNCTTLHASAALRLGLYDWDTDGLPGNLLQEFTSSSQISLTGTGIQSVAAASKMRPVPGWYYLCFQSNDSTAAISLVTHQGASGLGSSTGSREVLYYTKTGSYGALPSTGDKTASTLGLISSGGQPWAGFD